MGILRAEARVGSDLTSLHPIQVTKVSTSPLAYVVFGVRGCE